jgi:uncharacterized C2H2 Zn-finger protein
MSEVRTFFRYCPGCGKRFHIKLTGKKLLNEDIETINLRERASSGAGMAGRLSATVPTVLEVDVPTTVDERDFEYFYKCGHCGHVWTEMRTEEFAVKEK